MASRTALEIFLTSMHSALMRYFRRHARLRRHTQDLVQEVYVRMLRVQDPAAIRDPQAYLFTVASNLAKEQLLLERKSRLAVDLGDPAVAVQLVNLPTGDSDFDCSSRIKRLHAVLQQLSPKCRSVVLLHYRDEWSHRQIADHLNISTHMVKKYLAQTLVHCRRRMHKLGNP